MYIWNEGICENDWWDIDGIEVIIEQAKIKLNQAGPKTQNQLKNQGIGIVDQQNNHILETVL